MSDTPPDADLPARLRAMRQAAALSQRSLADRLQSSQALVSMVESGARTPSLELAQRWADMCGGTLTEGRREALIRLLHVIPDDQVDALWRTQQALAAGAYDWSLAEVLHEEGATDDRIAGELRCSPLEVAAWRQRVGRTTGRQLRDEDAAALWDQGMSDGQIAAELEVARATVQAWRAREGLRARRPASGSPTRYDWRRARRLHERGAYDREIAVALSCSRSAVGTSPALCHRRSVRHPPSAAHEPLAGRPSRARHVWRLYQILAARRKAKLACMLPASVQWPLDARRGGSSQETTSLDQPRTAATGRTASRHFRAIQSGSEAYFAAQSSS